MKRFTSKNVKTVRRDMEKALAEVEEKYGIRFGLGHMKYGQGDFRMTVEAHIKDFDGPDFSKERKAWKRHAPSEGLPADLLDEVVEVGGQTFKIEGWNTRAHKYPVVATEVGTGKRYKLTTFDVRLATGNVEITAEPFKPRKRPS